MRRKSTKPKVDKRKGVKREAHNIPDEVDLEIWHQEFLKLSKPLDENGYRKPITETELVGWIRKKFDEIWMKCPQKLSFLASKREPDYSPDTRRASMYVCNICKEGFTMPEVQVDHISGEHEFTKLDQIVEFANKRFMVGYNDLQVLCVECHLCKTLAERSGITFEEAKIEKQVIAICNDKADKGGKNWLIERGIAPAKNQTLRKIQIRSALNNGS